LSFHLQVGSGENFIFLQLKFFKFDGLGKLIYDFSLPVSGEVPNFTLLEDCCITNIIQHFNIGITRRF